MGVVGSVSVAGFALPASAAAPVPGFLYDSVDTPGRYEHVSKWNCPDAAQTILDCTVLVTFSGADYKAALDAPSGDAELPLEGVALFAVRYNSGPKKFNLVIPKKVGYNYATNSAAVVMDMSQFYFDSFSQDGPFNYTGMGGEGVSDQQLIGSGQSLYCSLNWDYVPDPDPVVVYGDDTQLGCLTTSFFEPSRLASVFDSQGRQPLSKSYAAQVDALDVQMTVVKSPIVADPKYTFFFAGRGDGSTQDGRSSDGSPAALQTQAFPASVNPSKPAISCGGAGFALDSGLPAGVSGVTSPSAATVFMYSKFQPADNSCLRANTASVTEKPLSTALASGSALTPEELAIVNDDASWQAPEPPPPPTPRPEFTSCVNFNPLDFKFDWTCIWASLFEASPSKTQKSSDQWDAMLDRIPFSYFSLMTDAFNKLYTNSYECVAWPRDGYLWFGVAVHFINCNEDLRDALRPLTSIFLSLFIAGYVGMWVIRKFQPSFGGGD